MRTGSFLRFILVNMVLVSVVALVQSDYSYRTGYFLAEGFVPSTSNSIFTFVTSATRASTFIPGLLTLDWLQVVLLVLILYDAAFVWVAVRKRHLS